SLKLYPNPVQNILEVQLESKNMGITYLTVLDTKGKSLQNFSFTKNENTIKYSLNFENLPAGTYILKVQQQGSVSFKKFIKL
nr:T9SS type A sorting domain-containing protein [Bacteroidota bacterium]